MTINACELTPARTAILEHPQSGCSGVRERTRELLQSVWDEAAPELSRLACAMGIDPGRAEDVLQDVYLTAWRRVIGLQFGHSLVSRSFMVPDDPSIRSAEQDHLPVARPWNDVSVSQRVDRREEKSKQPCWPPPGQSLDNTNSFSENTTCTVQRTTASEWF